MGEQVQLELEVESLEPLACAATVVRIGRGDRVSAASCSPCPRRPRRSCLPRPSRANALRMEHMLHGTIVSVPASDEEKPDASDGTAPGVRLAAGAGPRPTTRRPRCVSTRPRRRRRSRSPGYPAGRRAAIGGLAAPGRGHPPPGAPGRGARVGGQRSGGAAAAARRDGRAPEGAGGRARARAATRVGPRRRRRTPSGGARPDDATPPSGAGAGQPRPDPARAGSGSTAAAPRPGHRCRATGRRPPPGSHRRPRRSGGGRTDGPRTARRCAAHGVAGGGGAPWPRTVAAPVACPRPSSWRCRPRPRRRLHLPPPRRQADAPPAPPPPASVEPTATIGLPPGGVLSLGARRLYGVAGGAVDSGPRRGRRRRLAPDAPRSSVRGRSSSRGAERPRRRCPPALRPRPRRPRMRAAPAADARPCPRPRRSRPRRPSARPDAGRRGASRRDRGRGHSGRRGGQRRRRSAGASRQAHGQGVAPGAARAASGPPEARLGAHPAQGLRAGSRAAHPRLKIGRLTRAVRDLLAKSHLRAEELWPAAYHLEKAAARSAGKDRSTALRRPGRATEQLARRSEACRAYHVALAAAPGYAPARGQAAKCPKGAAPSAAGQHP